MKKVLFIGSMVALVAACQADTEYEPVETAQGLETAEAATPPVVPVEPEDPAARNEAERQAKRSWNKSPSPGVVEVDWPAANGYAHVGMDLLPESERQEVLDAPLPVMLPQRPDLLETAIVTRGENWYAVSLKDDGASLHLRGTRVAFDFADDVWTNKERSIGDDYTLTRTHQIVSVGFGAFGAAYTLDVECSRPMDDVRCTKDDYALGLANDLAVAGGVR